MDLGGWGALGRLHQDRAAHAQAAALFERALEADPSAYAAAYHLALSREQLGDAAGALAATRHYLALSAGVPAEAERRAQALALPGLGAPPTTPPPPDLGPAPAPAPESTSP